jgi:hypothetical protein
MAKRGAFAEPKLIIVMHLYNFPLSAVASTFFQGVVNYGPESLPDSCRRILVGTSFDPLVWADFRIGRYCFASS